VVWIHGACQAIYGTRFEQDYSASVVRALQLQFASVRQTLRTKEVPAGQQRDPVDALRRDYQALTYLMRRISCSRSGPYAAKLRLLRLDFQLLRLATGVLRLLSADAWRATLVDMTRVLEYFSQVTGQRLQASASLFAAVPAGGSASLLGICSYCRYVRTPVEESSEEWMPSESYQEMGGSTEVTLSHGICPECFDHLVKPTSAQPAEPSPR
jgi:hypothetical protein